MSDFSPGPARAQAEGIPVTVAPYASGAAGVRQSLEVMSQKMREGRLDPAIAGWARGVLKDAGIDGRDGFPIRRQAAALLAAIRAQAIYTPDAYGAEVISSAAATLCLRPGLCLNGGDCDDLTVALGSALLSLGIPTVIVKQDYGGENQQHVLIAFQDESGDWVYADPSTNAPLGSKPRGVVSEIMVDPMQAIGQLPDSNAQIVTFGRPFGFGAPVTTETTWELVTDNTIIAGNRYRLGVLLSTFALGASLTPDFIKSYFGAQWVVESAAPTGDVAGGVQTWVVQGVARTTQTLKDDAAVTYSAVAMQTTTITLPAQTAPVIPAPASHAPFVSVGSVAVAAGIIAISGGILWGLQRRAPRRRRRR